MRMKGFGAYAETIANLEFLNMFDFHNFKTEKGLGVKFEAVVQKGGCVENTRGNLNVEGTWDVKEYGPLSDVSPGQDKSSNLHFLVKVVKMGEFKDEMMLVEVIDEENTSRSIHVHECHTAILFTDHFYVIHRAKIIEGVGVVDGWSMLVIAPDSYTW